MTNIKRIYDKPSASDGYRILIDRLWPRGVSKQSAALDLWLKEIAPSTELRKWFSHKPERFAEFSAKYETELQANPAAAELKKILSKQPTVTLLYGARDPAVNHAVVLARYMQSR